MGLLTFSRQCPFTENTPLLLTGVPGIFFILVTAFFINLHIAKPDFVPTISHTARQFPIWFCFTWFVIIQIEFMAFCFASGGLIAIYTVGIVLLSAVLFINPTPDKNLSLLKQKLVLTHRTLAFFLFGLVLAAGICVVVYPIGAFNTENLDSSITVKRLAVVLMILMILACGGMFYIMGVLNRNEEEPWTEPVSYLERLFMLLFLTILLLVPKGELV